MQSFARRFCTLVVALLLGLLLFPTRHASAANFTVNSLADTPDALLTDGLCADASGACTLRAAIQQANADPPGDTIGFSVAGTINLTGALPDLSKDVTINGPGADHLTVRRASGGDYRIFTVKAGVTAFLSGLTVSNGHVPIQSNFSVTDFPAISGGGVSNLGTLTMTNCVVSDNSTSDAVVDSTLTAGGGGGIFNQGTLTLTNCIVSHNATGSGSTRAFNFFGGSGGGISNDGVLTMKDCTVVQNTTGRGGDGVDDGGAGGRGGGINNFFPGVATITHCTVASNLTGNGGAAQGSNNNTSGFGGHGGGIFNDSTMTLTASTISSNRTGIGADARPGVVSTAGSGGSGGGVYNGGTLTVVNSVFASNVTGTGGASSGVNCSHGNGGDGGGIANPSGTLRLSQSTIVGNQTGLLSEPCGRDGVGGGVFGGARLRGTLIALNHVRFPTNASDVSGTNFDSRGYNYIGISGGGCCFTNLDRFGSSVDPGLNLKFIPGTLIPDNGSVTLDGGLALDVDDQPVTTDVRGAPRPVDDPTVPPQTGGDNSDIGAFERQSSDLTTVQLSASTSNVTEGCVQTDVNVTRAGPKDGTTQVTYIVSGGSASQRGDFTYTTGRVTFAPGEETKTIPVLISEDAYAEGPEDLSVVITNVTGGRLGTPNLMRVQIDDNDSVDGATNPIDDNATFVGQHYHDFLNRQADPGGQTFWTNQLASCGSDAACLDAKRVDVSAAFFLSIEFQNTGYYVIRVNKVAFGDRPENPRYLSFLEETQEVGRGVVVGQPGFESVLEANKQSYAEEIVASPDFQSAHGSQSQSQYVDSLFANAGVTPTQAERDAAINAFGSGDAAGRASSLRNVVESGSVYNKLYNPAFVLMQYFAYLRRNPDNPPDNNFDGYNFWLSKLNQFTRPGEDARDESVALARVRRAEMIRAFLLSSEYRGRFQGDPNRGSQFGSIAKLGGLPDSLGAEILASVARPSSHARAVGVVGRSSHSRSRVKTLS